MRTCFEQGKIREYWEGGLELEKWFGPTFEDFINNEIVQKTSPKQKNIVSNQQFLYLSSKGWKTGRQHEIEIWFVSYAGKYYVISERKEKADWVQNIIHNPTVIFTVNSISFEGTARTVDKHIEHKLAWKIANLMNTKYGWSDGLIVELTPHKKQIK